MRKLLLLLAVGAAAAAVTVMPAGAVTGNFQPDSTHVYVGLVAFYDDQGHFLWRCTGSLLNPTTFLTAGHCTDTSGGAASAIVWVSQEGGKLYDPAADTDDPLTGYPYDCFNSTAYPCAESHTLKEYGFIGLGRFGTDTHDVGLLILDSPIDVGSYASLGEAGSADSLHPGTVFTASGYGVSREKPSVISYRERLMTTEMLISTRSVPAGFNLQLSANPGNGKGGTCFGDSGGPVLYDDTDTILGVNSFVLNGQCGGTSFAYRTDQADVIDWITGNAEGAVSVVPLP